MSNKAIWDDNWNTGQEVKINGNVYHATRVGKAIKIADSGVIGNEGTPARFTTDPQNLKGDVNWDALLVYDSPSNLIVQAGKDSPYRFEHELYHPGKLNVKPSAMYIPKTADLSMLKYMSNNIKKLDIPVYWGLDGEELITDVLN
jgi:hypothetical protein